MHTKLRFTRSWGLGGPGCLNSLVGADIVVAAVTTVIDNWSVVLAEVTTEALSHVKATSLQTSSLLSDKWRSQRRRSEFKQKNLFLTMAAPLFGSLGSGVAAANQTKESEVRELSGKESGTGSRTPFAS